MSLIGGFGGVGGYGGVGGFDGGLGGYGAPLMGSVGALPMQQM